MTAPNRVMRFDQEDASSRTPPRIAWASVATASISGP